MDQLVVILIVGAVAFVKWLVENAGKSAGSAGDDTPDYPAERPAPRRRIQTPPGDAANPTPRTESDEEKMRRFMEALGLPSNGVPPPQPQRPAPRRSSEPRSVAPPAPRPIIRRAGPQRPAAPVPQSQPQPAPQPARRSIAAPLDIGGPLPEIPKSRPMSESAPDIEVSTVVAQAAANAGSKPTPRLAAAYSTTAAGAADLREQLRDPAALRRAILLREILGEPKGLQSLESPSIFSPL